jgi:hypothetical protein
MRTNLIFQFPGAAAVPHSAGDKGVGERERIRREVVAAVRAGESVALIAGSDQQSSTFVVQVVARAAHIVGDDAPVVVVNISSADGAVGHVYIQQKMGALGLGESGMVHSR